MVGDQQARLQRLQARKQFFAQAKAVERGRYRTGQGHGYKSKRPLRTVAHGNGHALTGKQAMLGLQARGQGVGRVKELCERPALVVKHQKLALAIDPSGIEQGRQALGQLEALFAGLPESREALSDLTNVFFDSAEEIINGDGCQN